MILLSKLYINVQLSVLWQYLIEILLNYNCKKSEKRPEFQNKKNLEDKMNF